MKNKKKTLLWNKLFYIRHFNNGDNNGDYDEEEDDD